MARICNSKLAKSNDKSRGSQAAANPAGGEQEAKKTPKPALGASSPREKAKASPRGANKVGTVKPTSPKGEVGTSDKVSQKLLETLERRRKGQPGANSRSMQLFAKPGARRGRRPKASAEYTPGNQEEETYVLESDYEGLEYDTGIRVKEENSDRPYNLDRFEDYDEELNFDW